MESDYHLLVCTGDLSGRVGDRDRSAALCERFFEPLAARTRCVAVLGNHDDRDLGDVPSLPVRILRNEWISVRVGGASIALAGVDQSRGNTGDIEAALGGVDETTAVVLLAHYPSTVFRVCDDRVRAVLCGHTHGGQIRLPLVGCVFANDAIPLGMARGYHVVRGRGLYVNSGLGVSTPLRFRLCCPPEIAVLTLRSAMPVSGAGRAKSEAKMAEVPA